MLIAGASPDHRLATSKPFRRHDISRFAQRRAEAPPRPGFHSFFNLSSWRPPPDPGARVAR